MVHPVVKEEGVVLSVPEHYVAVGVPTGEIGSIWAHGDTCDLRLVMVQFGAVDVLDLAVGTSEPDFGFARHCHISRIGRGCLGFFISVVFDELNSVLMCQHDKSFPSPSQIKWLAIRCDILNWSWAFQGVQAYQVLHVPYRKRTWFLFTRFDSHHW